MAKRDAWLAVLGLAALGVAGTRDGARRTGGSAGLARGASGLGRLAVPGPVPEPTPPARAAWLIDGRVSVVSGYGPRGGKWHNGADLAAAKLATIHAPLRGRVVDVWDALYLPGGGPAFSDGGRVVELRHAMRDVPGATSDVTTRYLHMTDCAATKGATVQAGDPIGRVGETRCVTLAKAHAILDAYGLDDADAWQAVTDARATWEATPDLVPDPAVDALASGLLARGADALAAGDVRLLVGVFEDVRNYHCHVEVHRVGASTLPDASGRPGDSLDPVPFFAALGVPLGEHVR